MLHVIDNCIQKQNCRLMSLSLERGDLLQLDPISHKGTLKLLPLGKKNKQKLVVGDDSGQISCYEFKRGEPQVVFQTKLFEGAVTSIALGGNPQKRDKIFASHSQRIVGLTKKGKEFFKLTSSLTETIQYTAVEDTRIWTGCEFVYNLYDNGKDIAYYISRDRINDLIIGHVTRDNDFDTVLGCQDNCVRIIHGSQVFVEIPTQYPVTCVSYAEIDTTVNASKNPTLLLVAMSSGVLTAYLMKPTGENALLWSVEDPQRRNPITCMTVFDINKDGAQEIMVGREDGRMEIFRGENLMTKPAKVFSRDIGESIRSIVCGAVNTPEYNEVLVASYSGKIISFTTEPVLGRAQEDNYGRSVQSINNENRIKFLQKEVDELRKKVEKEREKVKKIQATAHANAAIAAPVVDFPANTSFALDPHVAAYVLTIELQSAIDFIILRSPVVLDLVESDTGSAVLSVTPPWLQPTVAGEEAMGSFVAVFRCQSQEKRIILTLRTNEGEYGDLTVTIVAASAPKAAKIVKYNLKALSLTTKVHSVSKEAMERPRNRIRYTGNVQVAVIHEWIHSIFPDVPPRMNENALEETYLFQNTFTGAVTRCELRKNEVILESENASTIAIAKENITRLANFRRISLEETVNTNDATIRSFLSLIHDKLEHQLSLTRKMQLVDAIQEISMQEPTTEWMSAEYLDILQHQEAIRKDYKTRDRSLEYLIGILTDLYIDWNKLQGVDAKAQVSKLRQVLVSGDLEDLVTMFLSKRC